MVRIDLVRAKIARLRKTAASLSRCLPASALILKTDDDALDLVSFRFYLAMQEVIDICAHVVSDLGWGPVPTLRDHFSVLRERGVLPPDMAAQFEKAIKVRNLIGHAYAAVDPDLLHAAATALQPLIDPFCEAVLSFSTSVGHGSA
jgi:uncharacterized protein YutE (UPF0331/DUF86 family)